MKRRDFIFRGSSALLLSTSSLRAWGKHRILADLSDGTPSETLVGKPVDLASLGNLRSWTNAEASPLIQKLLSSTRKSKGLLRLSELRDSGDQCDLGVEWPEFRTIDRVVIRFSASDRAPQADTTLIQYWKGLSPWQGEWKSFENGFMAAAVNRENGAWTYSFAPCRTCKVRMVVQGKDSKERIELESFSVYGTSQWKSGDLRIEWGHSDQKYNSEGKLEVYNGQVLKLMPFGGTQLRGPFDWSSAGGGGKISGVVVSVLYTWGMNVDRTILTVRSPTGDYSFLPGEILEDQPMRLSDFGVYLRNDALPLDAAEFTKRNSGRYRVRDAVSRLPEQTLENAGKAIRVQRVDLSFVGVDSNNQKFGIAPDGHFVVGRGDPSLGKAMMAEFGIFFDSGGYPALFERSTPVRSDLFHTSQSKRQALEEGWLPIIETAWSENDLSFSRTDFGALREMPTPLQESDLHGDEPALLMSRLRIRNDSVIPQLAEYYIKPWKPAHGQMPYRAIPADMQNGWTTILRDDFVVVSDQVGEYALCYLNTHGQGSLSLDSGSVAVKYSVVVMPGQELLVDTVTSGLPLPFSDAAKLRGIDHDAMLNATVAYWKKLLAEGMTIEVPDRHMQNLYNANLHHFLLALTKDSKRGEYYPNVAMLRYGSIGSESSPVMQAMDMRGIHRRVERCLQPWLSTQGEAQPEGDYHSKAGGFFQFWPVYTIDQGEVLWALAEHYLYTRDKEWLGRVARQIVDGCDFIIRERRRNMSLAQPTAGTRPPWDGLAPAGCVADMRDWEYSFMLNGYFYLALKKSALALQDLDKGNAARIDAEAQDYRRAIRRILKECVATSPVTRLRDNTGVPSVPSYVGLRGLSSDVEDSVDPDLRHGYAYDSTIGPFHLLKCEVLEPDAPEVDWMLNYLEDRFFLFTPLRSRVDLSQMSTDWFNLGGFEKLQPYYVHYQDAYLQRDEIPNFLRGFFNTVQSIADPMTLTFQEELDEEYGEGGEPHKTHEEAWFFHQFRFMLVMEMKDDLFLARGTPREWLHHGKRIAVNQAPTYFGPLSYSIQSREKEGQIEARVVPPKRTRPKTLYLRLRHPQQASIKHVTLNGQAWSRFDAAKEWIEIPADVDEAAVIAMY